MNRKKIKLGFMFREESEVKKTWIYQILDKHFDVEFSSDPDYMICQVYDKTMQYLNHNKIRIFSCGENFVPDFNLVDYAISVYPIKYFDRNFWFPQCASGYMGEKINIESRRDFFDKEQLKNKEIFANFIYSHESENGIRGEFFKDISKYKRVDSAGTFLNNMPGGTTVCMEDGSKLKFQRKSKFTISFESNIHKGFCTEKITDAFFAETIPIYYGDPNVAEIFNPKAFINCSDYSSLNDVIEKVKWLDTHDDEYIKMINEPVFNDPNFLTKLKKGYEDFIIHIFEQPLKDAYRRSRFGYPRVYNDYYRRVGNFIRPIERTSLFKFMLNVRYNTREHRGNMNQGKRK